MSLCSRGFVLYILVSVDGGWFVQRVEYRKMYIILKFIIIVYTSPSSSLLLLLSILYFFSQPT